MDSRASKTATAAVAAAPVEAVWLTLPRFNATDSAGPTGGAASAATCAAGSVGATALAFGILSLMPISCNWKIRCYYSSWAGSLAS